MAYGVVYLYGLGSLTVCMTTLRGIAEHRRAAGDRRTEGHAALRNFTHGPLDRLFFGAYGFADHATHHAYPAVPCYLLPALTRTLAAADPALAPVGGHIAALTRLVRREPVDRSSAGTSTRAPSTSAATR